MLTMPAPIRQHLSGNVGRVRLRAAGWSRGVAGVPRAATRTQAPHIVSIVCGSGVSYPSVKTKKSKYTTLWCLYGPLGFERV